MKVYCCALQLLCTMSFIHPPVHMYKSKQACRKHLKHSSCNVATVTTNSTMGDL